MPGDIRTNKDKAHHWERVKIMAVWTENEILASTVKLCSLVRDNGQRHFARNIKEIKSAAEGFLPIPHLFYSQADTLRDGRNSEFQRAAWGFHFQSDRKQS